MKGALPHPLKEANKLTTMLDTVLGLNRFENGPVDVEPQAKKWREVGPGRQRDHRVKGFVLAREATDTLTVAARQVVPAGLVIEEARAVADGTVDVLISALTGLTIGGNVAIRITALR